MLHQPLPTRKHAADFAADFANFAATVPALRRYARYS